MCYQKEKTGSPKACAEKKRSAKWWLVAMTVSHGPITAIHVMLVKATKILAHETENFSKFLCTKSCSYSWGPYLVSQPKTTTFILFPLPSSFRLAFAFCFYALLSSPFPFLHHFVQKCQLIYYETVSPNFSIGWSWSVDYFRKTVA